MNAEEVATIQALLLGHWPNPAMQTEEEATWARTLHPLDFEQAATTLDRISESGKQWRPTDGEFLADYRLAGRYKPVGAPALAEVPATREQHLRGIERCREALQNARPPRGGN